MPTLGFRATLLGCTLALAACGGGGGGAAPSLPAGTGGSTPLVKAAFSFFIPSASAPSSAQSKRANYLPASTQSVVIAVLNSDGTLFGTPVVTNVTATNCPASGGGVICTITASLPEALVQISVVAFSGANGSGTPLSEGYTMTMVSSSTTSINVAMSGAAAYVSTSMSGGVSLVGIDHQAGQIAITVPGTTSAESGTISALPNGYDKITITSSNTGTPVGSIAYFREQPNGGGFYVSKGTSTNVDGSSTSGDWGVATAFQPCGSIVGTIGYNLVTVVGPTFASAPTTSKAFQIGTATVTATTLTPSGTDYPYSGTSLGPDQGTGQTCSNGIFSSSGNGGGSFDQQGVIVATDGGSNPTTSSHIGDVGFFAPSQPYSLNALASVPYYGAIGGSSVVSGSLQVGETPGYLTPAGGTSLTACGYTDFENDIVSTANCSTIALLSQPFPGVITGTVTSVNGNADFVGVVGQVNGKYVIDVIAVDTSTGQAENLALMQH